jgi:hypothetical protein
MCQIRSFFFFLPVSIFFMPFKPAEEGLAFDLLMQRLRTAHIDVLKSVEAH